MPLTLDDNLPTTFPTPDYLTLQNWKRGVITLIDKSRLPKDALETADNIMLVEDGQPALRWGVDWFGVSLGATIDGFDYFDSNGTIHLVVAAGGKIYRSLNDGATYTQATGALYTAGTTVNMNQNGGYLYITTGIDTTIRYDGTLTLQVYSALTTPSAPSVSAGASIAGSTYTYWYKVSAVNNVGFTAASPAGSVGVNTPRDTWTTAAANKVTVTHAAVTGATRYDYYISEDNINFFYVSSSVGTSTSFIDDNTSIIISSTTAPTANTTTGESYEELTNVGSRQFGVRNRNNRYRIGYTGTDSYAGSFALAYGGNYIDWQPGGKFIPVKVVDFKDKSNNPAATVFCDSADGQGCVLQLTIDEVTVDGITIDIPSIYRLPGSRGTPAPGSVVNVLNDYMFYNSQAFYNFGSRAQFLNMLSTDESSSNIRPTVKSISTSGESKIASVYFDAKVFFSVPYGSTTNNYTAIYDTERRAWLPRAFTIGFSKFLRYTATVNGQKTQKLLAYKPGDTRLSEISSSIQGDYGVAFASSLTTGLYPITKNRFDFQWTEEGELEFSNPNGTISVELLGIERNKGFRSTNQEQIQATLTTQGWDYFGWDLNNWDDTTVVPSTYSESSVKRYFNVQKELNAVQWRITTNSLDARYTLRTLQSWGTPTFGGKPRQWRLKRV